MHIVLLFLLGLFVCTRGFVPVFKALTRIMYGDEQRIADQEAVALRQKIEAIDDEILGKAANRIRIRFGLHQL